jgi:hypothetical protein
VASAKEPRTRLHALWTLDGLDALQPDAVIKALDDASRDVRMSALRISERWLAEPTSPVQAAVLKHLNDADWSVQLQLAASLGALPQGPRERALATLLAAHGDDPVALDAAVSGVGERRTVARCAHSGDGSNAAARNRHHDDRGDDRPHGPGRRDPEDPGRDRGSESPPWQRSALLRGAEVALLAVDARDRGASRRPEPAGASVSDVPGRSRRARWLARISASAPLRRSRVGPRA